VNNITNKLNVAIIYAGDREARNSAMPNSGKLPKVFEAFSALGVHAEPAVYHDDFCEEVKQQLLSVHAVLVWVNPIEGDRDRTKLDAMLIEVAATGVIVNTNPKMILKLGTKEVLVRTKDLGWGCDSHLYETLDQMRRELPARLSRGEARVLKQFRGHSGDGIWRIERESGSGAVTGKSLVRARHAKSGCFEEVITLDDFFERCSPYFHALNGQGRMVDQVWQPRLPEGMVRCYLVHDRVEGFGRQEIVALHPAADGAAPETAPSPTKRHYHPPTLPEFQRLKHLLESDWLPAAQRILGIETADLPALWDCDFMFGSKDSLGQDTYVLCEINVSCVSPFPDSAAEPLAKAVVERIKAHTQEKHGWNPAATI
jgi:hypothetical protein